MYFGTNKLYNKNYIAFIFIIYFVLKTTGYAGG